MKKKHNIQARLTIYGHDAMTDKQFKMFKNWLKQLSAEMQVQKRGDLSKIFRATLFKV